ncbi:peptidase, partial [Acinetobacter ursingii]
SPTLILCIVIFMVAYSLGIVKWGIPQSAHIVAYQLPEQSLNQLVNEAERYVLDWTTPSQLPKSRKQQIQKEYLAYVAEGQPAQLVFRGGGKIGANALALP